MENKRELQLQAWCESVTGCPQHDLQPVFGDARPWRYYRVSDGVRSLIAVDTMNTEAAMQSYLAVADAYALQNIQVPELVAVNTQRGFMLITDLGSHLLLSQLKADSIAHWYPKVYADLAEIMQVQQTPQFELPVFAAEHMHQELDLMAEWLLREHLQLQFSATEQQIWQSFCDKIVASAMEQPQVGTHRKFHARNILLQQDHSFAFTGFHDAAIGPITYDAVSLLRDCYIRWPEAIVCDLSQQCFEYLRSARSDLTVDAATWQRWFDWMGLQRHCYVSGLFARRYRRDGNPGYLQDIPRNLAYLHDIAGNYAEFDDFKTLLVERVLPALDAT
ncbi:aminoglycoside phosphotransferase family protein [Pseudidiomarina sediminum]|uniref:aminoglycoside phosphotransferase family protein n=1 Tax=Pseudidiomarina sediminum TaxID=431675 RepID=UPI0004038BB5|nr:phosphotransferase [Pseudidiomarina sediminum]